MNFYLMAGGFSSRMGRPKEALSLRGSSYADRIIEAASPVFDEVVAVRRAGTPPLAGVRTIFDQEHPGAAAIYGVVRALMDAPSEKLWICAVDRPLITTALLTHLSSLFAVSPALLLAIRKEANLDLLCAGWSRSLLPDLRRRITLGTWRLQDIATDVKTEIVEASDLPPAAQQALANVNEPADHERLRLSEEHS
jgi:molybdopterin-guanine dinucleotide biosynthesis protein A